ncbi:hypothetical protein I858_016380 (plasmid) [Planococcus versutus]|uniref:Uncharacterized protein n=2 Tax=Planococcus versutus TaxID=1302659 RepID=A0A1B1S5U0_9BACL|nr:hypothetical protein I858_016380 [Planococcus versutus]
MGQDLPHGAYLNQSWWKKSEISSNRTRAWLDAGYVVKGFHPNHSVVFKRSDFSDKTSWNEENAQEDIMLIRPTAPKDIQLLADLQKKIEGESDFLLGGKEQRALST